VYFPHLYPPLLRTLLALTSPPFCDASSSPQVIIGCKSIRILTLLHLTPNYCRQSQKPDKRNAFLASVWSMVRIRSSSRKAKRAERRWGYVGSFWTYNRHVCVCRHPPPRILSMGRSATRLPTNERIRSRPPNVGRHFREPPHAGDMRRHIRSRTETESYGTRRTSSGCMHYRRRPDFVY
jgi:hypothetical protein